MAHVRIVGGGFAGVEASWQLLCAGVKVTLHEMRPQKMTAAHKTSDLAELVCSNSFKSTDPHSAAGCLKKEMALSNSLVLQVAEDIGELKKSKNVAVLQNKRWNEILGRMILEGEDRNLGKEFVIKLFKAIHQESINHQEKILNA